MLFLVTVFFSEIYTGTLWYTGDRFWDRWFGEDPWQGCSIDCVLPWNFTHWLLLPCCQMFTGKEETYKSSRGQLPFPYTRSMPSSFQNLLFFKSITVEFVILFFPNHILTGLRRFLEVFRVTPGTLQSCVSVLNDGHLLAIAPGMVV